MKYIKRKYIKIMNNQDEEILDMMLNEVYNKALEDVAKRIADINSSNLDYNKKGMIIVLIEGLKKKEKKE